MKKQEVFPTGLFNSDSNGEFILEKGILKKYYNTKHSHIVVIPEGVKKICGRPEKQSFHYEGYEDDFSSTGAFYDVGINVVYIPNSVKEIGYKSFEKCDIKCIHFPLSLRGVSEFFYCDIKEAFYDGTKKRFISNPNSSWCSNCKVIHCLDGDITDIRKEKEKVYKPLLNKLKKSEIDQHYGFEEWNNLVVYFLEIYKLDDIKNVLGAKDYMRIKKELLADRQIREITRIDDPIVEVTIENVINPVWPNNSIPETATACFDRISGKLNIIHGKDRYYETNIWEDLTENYFRELEASFSSAKKRGDYAFDASINDVRIKRLSGKTEYYNYHIYKEVHQLNAWVKEIQKRINGLMDVSSLLLRE